jgi:hypothetical protein
MGHDQIFKEFLREFLKDFLRLFFPEIEARLDFSALQFLDTESFTSFPRGKLGAADVAAELRTREGAPELRLVHVEVQARRKRAFPKRMFQYYALLWAKHEAPVFPIAVYLRGGRSALSEEDYVMELFGREQLRFRYAAVTLARFEAREYVESGNRVAAALAALMSRGAREPLQLWLPMMERVALSGLDDTRKFLLLNLIETHFELAHAERQKIEQLLSKERYREVKKMQLTWAEKIAEKARKEGLLEGKRVALLQLLTSKFGLLPEKTASRVRAIESLKSLDRYLDRVLVASSLADMGLRD